MSDLDIEEPDPDEHPSGVTHVRITLWTEGPPGETEPAESVLVTVHDGEQYAVGDELVTAEERFTEFIESHLSGECDCLEADDAGE